MDGGWRLNVKEFAANSNIWHPRSIRAKFAMTDENGSNGDATDVGNDAMGQLAATVNAGVDRILQAFDEKIRYDLSKQQAIDRQHEELLGLRADLVARAARPFIFGMIHHHAEVGRLITAVSEEATKEMAPAKVCKLLESLQEDVEQVLSENGVMAYRAEVSEQFDPVRQTVVGKALATDDEERSGTIAACLGLGFERDGRILQKARVSVYRFEASTVEQGPGSVD